MKSGGELEAAVLSKPNPISPAASLLKSTLPEKTLTSHKTSDNSAAHYKHADK